MENTRIVARTRRFTVFHNEERGRLVACCMVCHYSVPIQNFDYFSSEYHKIMHILLKDRQTVTYIASFTKVSIRLRTHLQRISGCIKMGLGIDVLTGHNQLLLLNVTWCIYSTSNADNLSNLIKE
jgi:hypothetical protein